MCSLGLINYTLGVLTVSSNITFGLFGTKKQTSKPSNKK